MGFRGASDVARAAGKERLPGRVHVLRGNDPEAWRVDLSTYVRIVTEELYPGIALVWYANGGQLEFDLVVAPGARPELVELTLEGCDRPVLTSSGDLVVAAGRGSELRFLRPRAFQRDARGSQREIAARFVRRPNRGTGGGSPQAVARQKRRSRCSTWRSVLDLTGPDRDPPVNQIARSPESQRETVRRQKPRTTHGADRPPTRAIERFSTLLEMSTDKGEES